jgi:phosphohistidine phosphatase SixA
MLERGIPKPEKYLVSPLVRAIDTMNLTYGDLMEDDQKPMIIEVSPAFTLAEEEDGAT